MEVPVGYIVPVSDCSVSYPGWLYCDGRELKREDCPELFIVIGTEYGGGGFGSTTFKLPDLTASKLPKDPTVEQLLNRLPSGGGYLIKAKEAKLSQEEARELFGGRVLSLEDQ